MGIETKTLGQMIDELCVVNLKIWHLIDRVMDGSGTLEDAQAVQTFNSQRAELVRALDKRLGERDIGGKVYADSD